MARFGAGLRVYLNSMPLQWTRRRRQKEGGGEAVAQGETREVLLVGRDYAFVFGNGSGKSTVEIRPLEILRPVVGWQPILFVFFWWFRGWGFKADLSVVPESRSLQRRRPRQPESGHR